MQPERLLNKPGCLLKRRQAPEWVFILNNAFNAWPLFGIDNLRAFCQHMHKHMFTLSGSKVQVASLTPVDMSHQDTEARLVVFAFMIWTLLQSTAAGCAQGADLLHLVLYLSSIAATSACMGHNCSI